MAHYPIERRGRGVSKLFKLKEWLTVPDAARHLFLAFGEEVSEADVLRLALDGHLRLSVNFVNHAQARHGRIVDWMETKWEILPRIPIPTKQTQSAPESAPAPKAVREPPPQLLERLKEIPEKDKDNFIVYLQSLQIDGNRYLTLEGNIASIEGVWDLPMIGGEQLDIEHHYQMRTGGPAVTLETLEGAFVEKSGGVMCQLQEDFDDNKYQPGSKAQLRELEERIAIKKIKEVEAQKLLDKHKEDRKAFLEKRKGQNNANNYYPAGGLPEDAVIVVRTAALREFEQTVNGTPTGAEKPLTTTERNSLLTVIAGLCDYSDIKHQERGATTQIANMTEEIGAPVTDDTIRKILAKIPFALERRNK